MILLTNHVWPRNIHLWPLAHRLEVCRACRVQPFSSGLVVGLLLEPWPGTSEAADHNLTAGFAEGVSKKGKPIHAHMYIIYIYIYLVIHLFSHLFIYLCIYIIYYIYIYSIYIYYLLLYIYICICTLCIIYINTFITRCIYTNAIHYTHPNTLCSLCAHLSCGFPNESKYLTLDNSLALPNRLQDERPRFREWTWTKDTQAAPKREPLQFTTNYHEIITMVGYRSNHWTTPHGGFLSHGGSPQIIQVMDDHDLYSIETTMMTWGSPIT